MPSKSPRPPRETVYRRRLDRLREPKGHLTLVDACRRLGLMGTRVTLVLVGEGPRTGDWAKGRGWGRHPLCGKGDDPRSIWHEPTYSFNRLTEGSSEALMKRWQQAAESLPRIWAEQQALADAVTRSAA